LKKNITNAQTENQKDPNVNESNDTGDDSKNNQSTMPFFLSLNCQPFSIVRPEIVSDNLYFSGQLMDQYQEELNVIPRILAETFINLQTNSDTYENLSLMISSNYVSITVNNHNVDLQSIISFLGTYLSNNIEENRIFLITNEDDDTTEIKISREIFNIIRQKLQSRILKEKLKMD
jgi:hypothetical protein